MRFIEKHLRIIWWLSALAIANVIWFFIASISVAPIVETHQSTLDTQFFLLIGLSSAAFLSAVLATFIRNATAQRLLARAWIVFVLAAVAASLYVFSVRPEIAELPVG